MIAPSNVHESLCCPPFHQKRAVNPSQGNVCPFSSVLVEEAATLTVVFFTNNDPAYLKNSGIDWSTFRRFGASRHGSGDPRPRSSTFLPSRAAGIPARLGRTTAVTAKMNRLALTEEERTGLKNNTTPPSPAPHQAIDERRLKGPLAGYP